MLLITLFFYGALVSCGAGYNERLNGEYTVKTLRVLAYVFYGHELRRAEEVMAQALLQDEIIFNIEITPYTFEDRYEVHRRMEVMMMAGQTYDLFLWNGQPIHHYASSGLLTDIYTLIDQHPTIDRDDFFTNILRAYEFDGGLYAFPLTFGFDYVGINSTLPQSIIDRFAAKDGITMHEMFSIYNDLLQDYGLSFCNLHLNPPLTTFLRFPQNAFPLAAGDFVDFDNRISHLNSNEFIRFLEDFSQVLHGVGISTPSFYKGGIATRVHFNWALPIKAFINLRSGSGSLVTMFKPIEPDFLNFIPLVNNSRQLLINPRLGFGVGTTWAAVCIPAGNNSALAWDFTLHLKTTILDTNNPTNHIQQSMRTTLAIPIYRAYFRPHIEAVLSRVTSPPYSEGLIPFVGIHDDNDREQAIETAISRLEALSEMPAAIFETRLPAQFTMEGSILDELLFGFTSAEDTAQSLHNIASLWLIE